MTETNNEFFQNEPLLQIENTNQQANEDLMTSYKGVLLTDVAKAIKEGGIDITPEIERNLHPIANKVENEVKGMKEEIKNLKEKIKKLEHEIKFDHLTNLYTFKGFKLMAEEIIQEREELKKENKYLPISFAYIDLDNFKPFNDIYGHETGNEVIEIFGNAIIYNIGKEDIGARFHGDEFAILFKGLSFEEAKRSMEEKIVKTFDENIKISLSEKFPGTKTSLSFTYGIKEWDGKQNFFDFINEVDKELLANKANKKQNK